jgi:hypothetical protein
MRSTVVDLAVFCGSVRRNASSTQADLRVVRGIAGHTKHHPDRITEHDPTTAGPESLGAKPNQPRRLGRDVVGAQVDVGPHLGRWVVGTQPLE